MFDLIFFCFSIFAGALASISGFGIGTLLTPVLALHVDVKLAVVAVTVPHFIATLIRFYWLRKHLNKEVFLHFGIVSAVGALVGASLHNMVSGGVLTVVFGALLIFVGLSAAFGLADKLKLGKKTAWVAGAISGAFGGLVGNQGGIRSAALLAFRLEQAQFVATATAAGLIVDIVRMPVYLADHGASLAAVQTEIILATLGTVIGTIFGGHLLSRVPPQVFRRSVAGLVVALGLYIMMTPDNSVSIAAAAHRQYTASSPSASIR